MNDLFTDYTGITLKQLRTETEAFYVDTDFSFCLVDYTTKLVYFHYFGTDEPYRWDTDDIDTASYTDTRIFETLDNYVGSSESMGIDPLSAIAYLTPILDINRQISQRVF